MENLIEEFSTVKITPKVSDSFKSELDFICYTVINHFLEHFIIYTDVLDILCHCGNDLAYDISDDFDADKDWFKLYGKTYIYNLITSNIELRDMKQYNDINNIYLKIRELYEIC